MLNFRSTLSAGRNAVRSFSTTQLAQGPLSQRSIDKLERLGLPVPPESGAFSPYNAFVKEYWTTHKAKHDPDGTEDVKVYDKEVFLKACGEAWRDLPTAEKTKYTDSSNELRKAAKEAYYAFYSSLKPGEFARINAALPPSSRIPRPSGTRIPDGVARRPGGSFMFFVRDKIDKSSDTLMKDQVSELGARWRNMSAEEKAPYIETSRSQRAAYDETKAEKAGVTAGSSA